MLDKGHTSAALPVRLYAMTVPRYMGVRRRYRCVYLPAQFEELPESRPVYDKKQETDKLLNAVFQDNLSK